MKRRALAPRQAGPGMDANSPAAAAGDSLTVAAWTTVSRVTGVARFATIGAVLGPTFFGNTYQFTNSLPNLVYYGFLAGSLFSSLLVPALVRHIDVGDRRASERVAGGFLGATLAALLAVTPVAVLLGPYALSIASLGGGPHLETAAQVAVGRLLILMFIPQVYCYGVVGTATAVMNAHQRFALAAAAPAVENLGTIAVLGTTAWIYGTGTSLTNVSTGELLLLGLGSTGAVVLHAATQWLGARRAGVTLAPRRGWHDPEVQVVIRRALPSLAQAGLAAFQMLVLLAAANQLPGGVVAFQIALNFYYLANSLATAPVALSLLPRLARMHLDDNPAAFRDTLARGLSLGCFLTIPAGVGYLVLARPIARAISFGRMGSAIGVSLVTVSLIPLSLAVVAQTAFMIATYASYARKDTRTPLRSIMLSTAVLLCLVATTAALHGLAVMFVLGLAVALSVCTAAVHLTARLRRTLRGRGSQPLAPSIARFMAGAVIMAGPAWITARVVPRWLGPPFGSRLGILAAALVGATVFVGFEALLGAEEVGWLAGGLGYLRSKSRLAVTGWQLKLTVRRGRTWPAGAQGRPGQSSAAPWPALTPGRPARRWMLGVVLLIAAATGGASAFGPLKALLALLVLLFLAAVWKWPALAAYLVIGVTPLSVGFSKHALPLIRPNELLDIVVGGVLAARGLARLRSGHVPRIRLDMVEVALLLLAVCSSVIPLTWEALRGQHISSDDLLYALVLWKLLGIYAIVRFSAITDQQKWRCLWISVGAACVVALIAVLQSLDIFGIQGLINHYYAYSADGAVTPGARGSSTLGLPAATADLMIYNLAIVAGLLTRRPRHRLILGGAAALLTFGALAAGEFSAAIGLLIGLICIACVTNSRRLLLGLIPASVVGSVLLWPVIQKRLSGFQSPYGLPQSWLIRLQNLRTYFWPTLFSHWNFLLGVRPAARIPVITQAGGFVWIESGYTWLLWGGGIPLLASFLFFVAAVARRGWHAARQGTDAVSVAGTASFVGVIVVTVLMIFDPHLTYRGSGDALFGLIALAAPIQRRRGSPARLLPIANGGQQMVDISPAYQQHDPATPRSVRRLLTAHLASIALITLAVTAGAGLLAWSQKPMYTSTADVLVYPPAAELSAATQEPDMATEQQVATSEVVLVTAARLLHVSPATLQAGASANSPANTYLLAISFKDSDAQLARRYAQGLADAYVAFRTPRLHHGRHHKTVATAPIGGIQAAIVTPASAPRSAASRTRLLAVGIGLILGAALGIGFALFRDSTDDGLRGPADLERRTGVPVLAQISAANSAASTDGTLAVVSSPGSDVADTYRNLRTRVLLAAAQHGANTLLVVSAARESTTAVTANLATAMALSGRQVVVVCAALGFGSSHEHLGVSGQSGLTNVLAGDAALCEALQQTRFPGLRVLPPGPVPADAAAVTESPGLRCLLDSVRCDVDFVFIEGPPVLSGAGASALAEHAQLSLLLAGARDSTRAEVQAAAHDLKARSAFLIGCVFRHAERQHRLPGLRSKLILAFRGTARWLRTSLIPALRGTARWLRTSLIPALRGTARRAHSGAGLGNRAAAGKPPSELASQTAATCCDAASHAPQAKDV